MPYANFEDRITERLGIVIQGWPLSEFQAPGKFNSRVELETLYNAWLNGTTSFRRMSKAEHKTWHKERLKGKAAVATSIAPTVDTIPADNAPTATASPASTTIAIATASSSGDTPVSPVAGLSTVINLAAPVPLPTSIEPSSSAAPLMTVFSMQSGGPVASAPPKKKKRKDAGIKKGPNAVTKRKLAAAQAEAAEQAAQAARTNTAT